MKHSSFWDSVPLLCVVTVVAAIATGCGSEAVPPAKYVRGVDCAYHVLDDVLDHNDELIDRVLSVGQGPFTIEELVEVMVELHKNDVEIIESGKRLRGCIPEELLQ